MSILYVYIWSQVINPSFYSESGTKILWVKSFLYEWFKKMNRSINCYKIEMELFKTYKIFKNNHTIKITFASKLWVNVLFTVVLSFSFALRKR